MWHASKIKRDVRSIFAAEALSLEETLGVPNKSIGITAYTDIESVIEAVIFTKLVDDKRLRADIAAI